MDKKKLIEMAAMDGSERTALGSWARARLVQRPEAGMLVQIDGNWYVAVAGVRREGYKGNLGGLYAQWVRVPESECKDW